MIGLFIHFELVYLVFHTLSYSLKTSFLNCYTIQYKKGEYNYFGSIFSFISIRQSNFCIVQRFEEITNSVFENLDILSKKYIYTFFVPVKKSVLYDLIELENINRRCILSENKDYLGNSSLILSPCHNLNDHD